MDILSKKIAELEYEIQQKIELLAELKEEMIKLLRHKHININTIAPGKLLLPQKRNSVGLSMLLDNQQSLKSARSNENDQWKSLVANQYNSRNSKVRDNEKYWRKKQIALKFMDSWMERIKNVHETPQIIINFSLFLWYHGCSQAIWKVLSRLRVSLSYNKTKLLLQESTSITIPRKLGWMPHNTIFVVGADNCAYYNAHTYTRDNSLPLFTNTINWYRRYWDLPFERQMNMEDDTFGNDYIDNKILFRYFNLSRV